MTTSLESNETVEAFASRARKWVAANLLPLSSAANPSREDRSEWVAFNREVQAQLFEGGFAGIMYPTEYGGQGLGRAHQHAFLNAAEGFALPSLFSVTHGILGPTLLDFGTPLQKAQYIPDMLAGKSLWVQFLSEPSGGSDMASARMRAMRDGDTYVMNGSKTWSTGADISDYALVLARTDWDAPKHRGLSMIVVPIKHPGVEVRLIELADNSAEFAEEYFDDVVVPLNNRVGDESDGWSVASQLLFHERSMVGGNSINDTHLGGRAAVNSSHSLAAIASTQMGGLHSDAQKHVGELRMQELVRPHAVNSIDAGIRSGAIPGPGASMLKLMNSKFEYRAAEIALQLLGDSIIAGTSEQEIHAATGWLVARTSTIAGGTSEMQLNQISERVLGLPRENAPDKGLPFSSVVRGA